MTTSDGRLHAEGPGDYIVELRRRDATLPFVSMGVNAAGASRTTILVPATLHTYYRLRVRRGAVDVAFDGDEVDWIRLRRADFRDGWRLIQRPRVVRRLQMMIADGVEFLPLLTAGGAEGRELAKAMRMLTAWGFGLGSRNLQDTAELFAPCVPDGGSPWRAPAETGDPPRFAVVIHLYYRDLWPEFEFYLRRLRQPFHLLVTTTEADAALCARIRQVFVDSEIVVLENRGRDIGPFLQLLHEGRLDDYPLICKLHSKRTGTAGARALLGNVWRRANLIDLIGTGGQVDNILERFDRSPDIGMIGSPRFRIPSESMQHQAAWGENKSKTLALAARLGIPPDLFRLDYFAGTMFWVRRAVLQPLKSIGLTLADFPVENGARDGEIHHAYERLFGALPGRVKMTLDTAPVNFDRPA